MTSVRRQYRNAAILPFLLIIGLGIISGIAHDLLGVGKDYKSEWSTDDGYWLSVIFAIIGSLFICLLSATILLNENWKLANNMILSGLTWFLLPGTFIAYIWLKHFYSISNFSHKFDSESIFVFAVTIPHLIGLIYAFIAFHKGRELAKQV